MNPNPRDVKNQQVFAVRNVRPKTGMGQTDLGRIRGNSDQTDPKIGMSQTEQTKI